MGLKRFCWAAGLLLWGAAQAAETNVMRTIFKGTFSGIQEESQVVVTNRAGFEKLWKQHSLKFEPKEPAPEVDFAKETVLAVSLGQKRTGGFSVEISDIRRAGEKTLVLVKPRSPKQGGFTIQALTAPIHMVAVPKIEGKVEFKAE